MITERNKCRNHLLNKKSLCKSCVFWLHYAGVSVFLRIWQKLFIFHRNMQKCHSNMQRWEPCRQSKWYFQHDPERAFVWIGIVSKETVAHCSELYWILHTFSLKKTPQLHHRNTRLHFLSGQKLFWQVNGPKGRMFFIGVTVLKEKILILCGFLQDHYWKLLEFHTVTEFIITEE